MKGTLIAMGGAVRPAGPLLQEFYRRSGGEDGSIIILPTASARLEAGEEYIEAFRNLGLKCPAQLLPVRQRSDANRLEFASAIRRASGIFITGGEQVRLVSILGGTPVHKALLERYAQGAVIGGTSAGTAALSTVMIAHGFSGSSPRGRIAHFSPGLGLAPSVIFDQHFRQRHRLGRLLYAVACHPGLLGVGIDEDTAVILQDDRLEVIGNGSVTVVDGSTITDSNIAEVASNQLIALSAARLHILTQGCAFEMKELRMIRKPPHEAAPSTAVE